MDYERNAMASLVTRINRNSDHDPGVTKGQKYQPNPVSPSAIQTDFAEFEDGTLIEMIEDPNDAANSLFAVYQNGTVRYAETVVREKRTLVPLSRRDEILKHVVFPRAVLPYESVEILLWEIEGLILDCVDLATEKAKALSAFVLSTWFIECLPVAPYIALVGLPGSGKTTLLELLNLLCRHALLTADISSAAFYDVYDKLTPTLLVDETLTAGDRRALFHTLRAGTTRGSVALRKGRSLKAFGPKVVSWTELPNDAALNSRCIIISMQESSRTDLKKVTDSSVIKSAGKLQMALLDYRLRNFGRRLRLPKVEGDQWLYSRSRDLYQALALPVGSDENTCRFLVLFCRFQQAINREPLSRASAEVLRALYEIIHSHPNAAKCANKDLLSTVNLHPGNLTLNAHEVGRALTSLGFTDRKRTNVGYIFWLDHEIRKRIHKLAHDHAIDQEDSFRRAFKGCDLCADQTLSDAVTVKTKGDSGVKQKQK